MTTDTVQWPCVVVRRYGTESQLSSEPAGPRIRTPDLLVLVNAPEYAQASTASMVLYLDPCDSPPRRLPDNTWQLCQDHPCSPQDFLHWANEIAGLLIKLLCERGLVCIDLVDLRLLLSQSRTQRLSCMLYDWPCTEKLPEPIAHIRCDYALALILAAPEDLSVELFSTAGLLLEQVIPAEGLLLLAGRVLAAPAPKILLIGGHLDQTHEFE